MNQTDSKKIVALYQKGLSGVEIAQRSGISWTNVYRTLRRNGVSTRSPSELNKIRFEKKPLSFRVKTNLTPAEQQLKVAGLMLWWAEGSKRPEKFTVDLANSDPRIARAFIQFLRRVCGVDPTRLRCRIFCYPNQDTNRLTQFWSDTLGVPASQFTKPYVRQNSTSSATHKMPHGLVHVLYSDKKLYRLMEEWLKQYELLFR